MKKAIFYFTFLLFLGCHPVLYTKKDPAPLASFEIDQHEKSHSKNSLEWWYFTGHLYDSSQNKRFGMEYVLFHFSPTRFKSYALVNLALSDPGAPAFYYDYKLIPLKKDWTSDMPLNIEFKKKIDFSIRGEKGQYHLQAKMDHYDVHYNLKTKTVKPLLLHHESGYENYGGLTSAGYYSYPRLETKGNIILKNEVYQVEGQLWYDRQWNCHGVTNKNIAWDWFSVQFDEPRSELMLYRLYNKKDSTFELLGGSYLDEAGKRIELNQQDIEIESTKEWYSYKSKASYPMKWQISIPKLDMAFDMEAVFPNQELELSFYRLIKLHYWEGMCTISGSMSGQRISGRGYVEMTNK